MKTGILLHIVAGCRSGTAPSLATGGDGSMSGSSLMPRIIAKEIYCKKLRGKSEE